MMMEWVNTAQYLASFWSALLMISITIQYGTFLTKQKISPYLYKGYEKSG